MKIKTKTDLWQEMPKEKLEKISWIITINMFIYTVNTLYIEGITLITLNGLMAIFTITALNSIRKTIKNKKEEE